MTATTGSESRRFLLAAIRKDLSLTQAEMAKHLGLSLRAYSDLENGVAQCKLTHVMAAERLTLLEARRREQPELIAQSVRADIKQLMGLP